MSTVARKSATRKFVICGGCRNPLCRIDRRERAGGPVRLVDGRRTPGTEIVHVLTWGNAWNVVGDHIETTRAALDRMLDGNAPRRRDWTDPSRFELSEAVRRYAPVRCPDCGEINVIDPKKLDVDGVAPY